MIFISQSASKDEPSESPSRWEITKGDHSLDVIRVQFESEHTPFQSEVQCALPPDPMLLRLAPTPVVGGRP
jgi:hypothetical protein